MPAVLWFRRDLRLRDHPALARAYAASADVVALFVIDERLWASSGPVRREWLRQSLHSLNEQLGGRLWVISGDPTEAVAQVVRETGATSVHISEDFGVYGTARDARVRAAVAGLGAELIATGSPYVVDPGAILTGGGTRYRVYTPYYRQWRERTLAPICQAPAARWVEPPVAHRISGAPVLAAPHSDVALPPVGEAAAWRRWNWFKDNALADYDHARNRPDVDGTSSLSAHLRWGEIHPRSLLADLAPFLASAHTQEGATTFGKELAWRDFYADVWHANPASAWASLDPRFDSALAIDRGPDADARFAAWAAGRTGFPFVDAGMRQLQATGWMHNRVRMVTASFLVKGLHLPWQRGAAHFMTWLRDGDAASNQHGWQWVAGCGTDAAPFHRIFNPVKQGLTFDPQGDYVRRWIPELAGVLGASAHEPWKVRGTLGDPVDPTYPEPIIDHSTERQEALRRFAVLPPRNG